MSPLAKEAKDSLSEFLKETNTVAETEKFKIAKRGEFFALFERNNLRGSGWTFLAYLKNRVRK